MDIEILRSDERYRIANMSDEEAVDILRKFLKHGRFMMGRGNGKMIGTLKLIRAISKGIEALEERNDKNEAYKIIDGAKKIIEQGGNPGPKTMNLVQEVMSVISKKEETEWCTVLNDLGHDIERHARDEFDTFLEKCLKPYGISKENAYRNANRVSIEKEVFPDTNTTYLRFYIDHEYKFTISIAQKPDTPVTPERYYARVAVYYRKIFEGDVIQNTEDWIPVSKSLPDKISNIWITIEYNGIRETKPAKFIPQESPHFYYVEGKPVTDAKILAWRWRNTPDPYLGKEKQNE